MNNFKQANIDTLENGDAKERFNYELGRAIQDCLDLNKDPKKARKVILEVILVPGEERKGITVTYQAKSKLVPDKPGSSHFVMAQDGTPYVNDSHQMDIEEAISTGVIENYDAKTGEIAND